jgi:hypothetical protein
MARKPKKTTTPTRRKTTPPTAKVKRQQIAAETEAKAMATLAPLAKEINHRLEQASKLVDDAYDHRLAAALQLDKAKKLAEKRKINFQQWCKENVSHGYENVRKLVAVGGASNPKRALEDLRGRVNEASKKSRAKLIRLCRQLRSRRPRPRQHRRGLGGWHNVERRPKPVTRQLMS